MREILFRGKRIDNGEWVEGSFLLDGEAYRPSDKEHLPFSKCYIVPETDRENVKTSFNNGSLLLETTAYHVIPDTVGQFTGLTDKNGKRIFEGDIIRHYNRDDIPTAFDVGQIFWDTHKCRWLRTSQKCDYNPEVWSSSAKGYEIIGNIHDNPELLEVNVDG